MTTWHAPPDLLDRYARRPEVIDDTTASSVEQHLLVCADCRGAVAAAAGPDALERSWADIADRIDQPRPAWFERLLVRVGIRSDLGRLLAATPALRGAAVLAICVLAVGAALLSRSAEAEGPFLVLAPLVALAAVAASFAPAADPAGEAGVATPVHGVGLVVRRAVAVVGISFGVLGLASLALPDVGFAAATWVLPALALSLGALALGTWLRVEVAVAALAVLWVAAVWSVWWLGSRDAAVVDSGAFGAGGQFLALALAVAAAMVVAIRRDRFATLEAS